MALTMFAPTESKLITFNTLALHYQDDAYTLAYYFLGDEARAEEITQEAFSFLYQRQGHRLGDFQTAILRQVLTNSQNAAARCIPSAPRDRFCGSFQTLETGERAAAILVDVLQLSYTEAARVLDLSVKQVSRVLTQARLHLSQAETAKLAQ